jgi:hypothetical protein
MTDSDFTRLLNQAVKTAKKHRGLMQRINRECVLRFGKTYGELSIQETIDLEASAGYELLTAKRFEQLVKQSSLELH